MNKIVFSGKILDSVGTQGSNTVGTGELLQRGTSDTDVENAGAIHRQYGEIIRKVIQFHADPQDVDDIFQDTFVSFISNPPRNVENIKGYLCRVTTNVCYSFYRRKRRYQTKIHDYADFRRLNESGKRPLDILTAAEDIETIFEIIEKDLSPSAEIVLKLKYKEDLNHQEIGKKMHIKYGCVRSYLSNALKNVRNKLKK